MDKADYKRVADAPGRLDLANAPEGFDALVMADVVRARGGLSVFVARDGSRAQAFISAMTFFAPEVEVLFLPSWDCLPYDRISPSGAVSAQRMAVLDRLARGLDTKPRLLVTPVNALIQKLPPRVEKGGAAYAAAKEKGEAAYHVASDKAHELADKAQDVVAKARQ